MVGNHTIGLLSAALFACGQVADDHDAAADAQTEVVQGPCTVTTCSGSIELPVGASITGDDLCFWRCSDADTSACDVSASCGHCGPASAPDNVCDGGVGPYGPQQPSCLVPTCTGEVKLPYRALMLGDDGCGYTCFADAATSCGPFNNEPCTCGQLICDGGK
jgi:hypothetical protein